MLCLHVISLHRRRPSFRSLCHFRNAVSFLFHKFCATKSRHRRTEHGIPLFLLHLFHEFKIIIVFSSPNCFIRSLQCSRRDYILVFFSIYISKLQWFLRHLVVQRRCNESKFNKMIIESRSICTNCPDAMAMAEADADASDRKTKLFVRTTLMWVSM